MKNSRLSELWAAGVMMVVAVLAPSLASATTLTGDSIQIYYLYPTESTIYDTLGPVTVPNNGTGDALNWSITGNEISLIPDFGAATFGTAPFNGYEFVDLTKDPDIIGVTVDAASTASGVSLADVSFTSNSVFFNFQGQTLRGTAVYDLAFAPITTPLPPTLTLFAAGLGALGFLGWRRKRKNAAALAAA